jgi:thioredoxin 2
MEADRIIVECANCGARNRVPVERLREHPLCGRCHRPLDTSAGRIRPLDITDRTFAEEIMHYSGTVLVMFWSPRCPYCRQLVPTIDRLVPEYAGRARIARLDVDQNRVVPSQFGINGVPTLLLIKNGKVIKRLGGVVPQEELERNIQALL